MVNARTAEANYWLSVYRFCDTTQRLLARWNHHVLVNDALPQLCSFLDMDVLEED
jgi:hypothetical protein